MILGLITTTAGLLASDAILGAATVYANFYGRGLESNDLANTGYAGNTLTTALRVSQPGDWMRVVTVATVPVPAAGGLLVVALGGLSALRRRKTHSA